MLRQTVLLLTSLLFFSAFAFLLYRITLSPRTDHVWIPEQERVAYAEGTDTVTLYNVRDWTYSATSTLSTAWTNATIDPSHITRAWFYIEPFSDWEAVGHTFLGFELSDGRVFAFSVEARREVGEEYSALRGLFNEYELSYQWGTERDFVTRRLIYLDHPLRAYPLQLEPEGAQALFRTLVEETNRLAERPRFYNTLAANCTNVLANIVNSHYKGRLNYDLSWYLTGYADEYLMREHLILQTGTTDETRTLHDLTPLRAQIAENATSAAFSTYLRSLLPTPQ